MMCRYLAVIRSGGEKSHECHNHKKTEVHTWSTLAPSRCVMGSRRVVYMQSKLYSSESPWFTSFVWAKYNHTGQSYSSESPWFTSFVWAKYSHTGQSCTPVSHPSLPVCLGKVKPHRSKSYSSESPWFTSFVWAKYNHTGPSQHKSSQWATGGVSVEHKRL